VLSLADSLAECMVLCGKFVHLYRDGRECAYSFSHHPAYRLGAVSAMLDSRLGMSPYLDDAKPPEQAPFP
jgi:hypothetical protein